MIYCLIGIHIIISIHIKFAKFATALALAKFMSSYGYNIHKWRDFAFTLGIIFLPMIFIVLQHETGSALVYTAFFLMLYREGMTGSVLFTGVADQLQREFSQRAL